MLVLVGKMDEHLKFNCGPPLLCEAGISPTGLGVTSRAVERKVSKAQDSSVQE